MRNIFAVIIAMFLFFPSSDFLALSLDEGAETKDSILSQSKEIISEGTYNMGDKLGCENLRALEKR